MEIREKHLPASQTGTLGRQRLLDLYHQLGVSEDRVGIQRNPGTRGDVEIVVEPGAEARSALHQHLMAVAHKFGHRRGHEADAILMVLDFLGNANTHHAILQSFILAHAASAGRDLHQMDRARVFVQ